MATGAAVMHLRVACIGQRRRITVTARTRGRARYRDDCRMRCLKGARGRMDGEKIRTMTGRTLVRRGITRCQADQDAGAVMTRGAIVMHLRVGRIYQGGTCVTTTAAG